MLKFILIATAFSLNAFASIPYAPKNYTKEENRYVFVDFKSAAYKLVYDVESKVAGYKATIEFEQLEKGRPLFDVHMMPLSISVNDNKTSVISITDPDEQTSYKAITAELNPGVHKMVLTGRFEANIKFTKSSARSGFWMSDLTDSYYLEQYLPSNLEFDQFQIDFEVKIIGTDEEHEIFTNGEEKTLSKNHFKIKYPSYFTTSSVFFQLSELDRFKKKYFNFNSISGRIVPVRVYSKSSWSMSGIEKKVTTILEELEQKFGAWGHPGLTIHIAGMGGMEHSGATITSLGALGHELTHSYFTRGVMPVNGNSGWIDEAVASWRDKGYKSSESPFYSSAKMSGFSEYKRKTDMKAYSEGASFMAYLNYKLQGGLEKFLSSIYETHLHKFWTTEGLIKELNNFSGQDFTDSFNRYIFGKYEKSNHKHQIFRSNKYHPKLSKQQLLDLL